MRRIIAFIILVILVIVMIVLSYNFYSKNKNDAKNNLNSTLKVSKKKLDDIEIKTEQKAEDKEETKEETKEEATDEEVEGDLAIEEDHEVPDTASEDDYGYIPVKAYDVSPNKTVLNVGESGKINVSIYPKNASNREVVFLSSNPKILKVDSFGKMKALRRGEVTVTVKVSGQKDSSFIVSVK